MKRDTQATMFRIVNQWRESGTPIGVFAQKVGLTKSKLAYWARKAGPGNNQESMYPEFIEIDPVSPHLRPRAGQKALTPEKLQVELTFPSGLCLKIFG